MKEATDFFNDFRNSLIAGLYTSAIGQIISYDAEKMQADVKLVPGGDLITAVPVATIQTSKFVMRVPYQKGDYVMVSFSMRDIDSVMHEDTAPETDRMASIDDAIVVCGINLFTRPLPKTHVDVADNNNEITLNPRDLLIASKDMKTRFLLSEAGGIKMYDDTAAGIEIVAPLGVTIRADNPKGNGVKITGMSRGERY
ncbi:hypothetical protein FB479_11676 [Brevibacillus sp. AG162]|uniref:Gp138 family membrane-puncturing spike protein n=1 Tax=Brevibacillus sp. AG162 TaxID=2572910 RepID=UPI001153E32A|nr:Gp138 family membrane-puncturing spike protein [Brevibacillus sp. AG162]TQK41975.1 hypothetical protein FB479_11676 [Brevibacillus sp. AG162]